MCPSKSGRFACQCGVMWDKGLPVGGHSKWIYMQASATAFRDSRKLKKPLFIQPYMPRMHLDLHVDVLGKQSICMRVMSSARKAC